MRESPWRTYILSIALLWAVASYQYRAINVGMREHRRNLLVVPVTSQPLQPGIRLTADDLTFRPRLVQEPAMIVRDPARVENRYLTRALEAGDTIRETDLSDHPGTRTGAVANSVIVTVQLPADRSSGTDLNRGDTIDVWTTSPATATTKALTAMLAGGVTVVNTKPTDGDTKGTHVSVLVPREQASVIVSALAGGGIVSITRGVGAVSAKSKENRSTASGPPRRRAAPGK